MSIMVSRFSIEINVGLFIAQISNDKSQKTRVATRGMFFKQTLILNKTQLHLSFLS